MLNGSKNFIESKQKSKKKSNPKKKKSQNFTLNYY